MKAREAAREAAPRLARAGVPDPGFEAELLARNAAGLSRAQFFAGQDLRNPEITRFHELIRRRLQREPAAHLLGTREFYGLDFEVTPDALVPRPETELLVDLAIAESEARRSRDCQGAGVPGADESPALDRSTPPLPTSREPGGEGVIVDVGTGTGCVAIATALHLPQARVVATDISSAALAVARRNRDRHGASVQLVGGGLASAICRADIILANLPYIPSDEVQALEPEIRDYEPVLALDGGPDGLVLIRRLIDDCAVRLRPRLLALEVGYSQADSVQAYAKRRGATTELVKDLAGINRVVCARWA